MRGVWASVLLVACFLAAAVVGQALALLVHRCLCEQIADLGRTTLKMPKWDLKP